MFSNRHGKLSAEFHHPTNLSRFSEVYGQRARDLKLHMVDWHDYVTELKKRPSPYEFPAFEHEERGSELRHDRSTAKTGEFMIAVFIELGWLENYTVFMELQLS